MVLKVSLHPSPAHRKQMMEIDNVLLWLAMEFEKQTNFINEVERKRTINGGPQPGGKAGGKTRK